MTIASIIKRVLRTLDNNSPMILTSLATAGVFGTVILAVKITPEAIRTVEREQLRLGKSRKPDIPDPTKLDIIKCTWQLYIPAASMGLVTIACIVGSQSINSKRQAALISGFTLAETAFREYRESVTKQLGVKPEQKIRDEIAKNHIEENALSKQVIITGNGEVLCYDTISGRYFKSDMETLRRAQNDINAQCINEMYASQNDFYRAIGLPINGFGEEFGWSTDVMLELEFSAIIAESGEPCISIDYRATPIRGYYKIG